MDTTQTQEVKQYDLILVDGNNKAMQISHSVRRDVMDERLNQAAQEAFRDLLLGLYRQYPDAGLVICWDHPESSSVRRAEFSAYKQHREHDPVIGAAVEGCLDFTVEKQLTTWQDPGYEADDLIASLVSCWPDRSILLVSNDRDLHQHIGPRIHQCTGVPMADGSNLITARQVAARYGVGPRCWNDFCALKGDSSDGIPGVRDIGEKTASLILQHCGSLESLSYRIQELEGKLTARRMASLRAALQDGTVQQMLRLVRPRICQVPESVRTYVDRCLAVTDHRGVSQDAT